MEQESSSWPVDLRFRSASQQNKNIYCLSQISADHKLKSCFQDEMYVESWGCSIEFLTTVHMMIAVRWRSNFCYKNRNPKKINKINNKFAE